MLTPKAAAHRHSCKLPLISCGPAHLTPRLHSDPVLPLSHLAATCVATRQYSGFIAQAAREAARAVHLSVLVSGCKPTSDRDGNRRSSHPITVRPPDPQPPAALGSGGLLNPGAPGARGARASRIRPPPFTTTPAGDYDTRFSVTKDVAMLCVPWAKAVCASHQAPPPPPPREHGVASACHCPLAPGVYSLLGLRGRGPGGRGHGFWTTAAGDVWRRASRSEQRRRPSRGPSCRVVFAADLRPLSPHTTLRANNSTDNPDPCLRDHCYDCHHGQECLDAPLQSMWTVPGGGGYTS